MPAEPGVSNCTGDIVCSAHPCPYQELAGYYHWQYFGDGNSRLTKQSRNLLAFSVSQSCISGAGGVHSASFCSSGEVTTSIVSNNLHGFM